MIWQVYPDWLVRSVWKSKYTDEEAYINPDWYEQNGTPMDSEGEDMEYSHTEISQ